MLYLALFFYLTSALWCYHWTIYASGGFAPRWYSLWYAIFSPIMIWHQLWDFYGELGGSPRGRQ